jgi:hypothetical protein
VSPEEVEILAVERKLVSIDKEARTLWRELAAIRQGLQEAQGAIAQAGPTTCVLSVQGTVYGCGFFQAVGLSGATVEITLQSSGTLIARRTTDGRGSFSIPGIPIPDANDMAIVATITSAGYSTVQLTGNPACSGGNAFWNFGPGIRMFPDASHHCNGNVIAPN